MFKIEVTFNVYADIHLEMYNSDTEVAYFSHSLNMEIQYLRI